MDPRLNEFIGAGAKVTEVGPDTQAHRGQQTRMRGFDIVARAALTAGLVLGVTVNVAHAQDTQPLKVPAVHHVSVPAVVTTAKKSIGQEMGDLSKDVDALGTALSNLFGLKTALATEVAAATKPQGAKVIKASAQMKM